MYTRYTSGGLDNNVYDVLYMYSMLSWMEDGRVCLR